MLPDRMCGVACAVPAEHGVDMAKNTKHTPATTAAASGRPVNIGISDADRQSIAESLGMLLADTYTLYLTTHNFHWNVTGPMFNTLHTMFMQQYTELWTAVDPIAERIRSLGTRRLVHMPSSQRSVRCPMPPPSLRRRCRWWHGWPRDTRPSPVPPVRSFPSPMRPATSRQPIC